MRDRDRREQPACVCGYVGVPASCVRAIRTAVMTAGHSRRASTRGEWAAVRAGAMKGKAKRDECALARSDAECAELRSRLAAVTTDLEETRARADETATALEAEAAQRAALETALADAREREAERCHV